MSKNAPSPSAQEKWRESILAEVLAEAPFDGWTHSVLEKAALTTGMSRADIDRGDLHLIFPKGISDVLTFWSQRCDEKMVAAFEAADPAPTRIRDKVTLLVRERLEAMIGEREAARRASATLALPTHAGLGPKLTWATADAIWRALGDTSSDFNYYTKRATLSAVYLSTLTCWFANEKGVDSAEPYAETWAFLDKRIDNVMQFEKVKADAKKCAPDHNGLLSALANLRYSGNRS